MTDTNAPESCVVHPTDYDPECELCKEELAAVVFQVTQNAQANALIEQRLAQMGQPVQMLNILFIRLNTLIEAATGGNPKAKAKFDLQFMHNYATALKEADSQAARQKLLNGVRLG